MSENDLYSKLTKFIEQTNTTQTEQIKNHIKKEIEQVEEIIEREITKRKELEIELQEIKEKYKILEKELRKNNIIIFNFGYNEKDDLLNYSIQKLNNLLQINLKKEDINNIYAIGKKKENRPVIIKFTSHLSKLTVFKNCKKLKGTNISIAEELTLDERKKQKILRQNLKKARAEQLNAYIKGETLYINEKAYKAEELVENEEDSENEQEDNETIEQLKSNSGPQTFNVENEEAVHIQEEEGKDEEEGNKGNLPKKRKISNLANNTEPGRSRSSPRFIEKEIKQVSHVKKN